ncbi:ribonuclease HII [Clostridiaceae bacterium M8S5]|nr:ribonuclease HII [Clostridiaceae bacterium M8S5]
MLSLEKEIWEEGYEYIACIDEVGRGCLAGDVVACAVVMPKGLSIEKVNDSKKLSPKLRDKLSVIIKEKAIAIGIGTVSPAIIDDINIKNSTRLAMKKAIENLTTKTGDKIVPDYVLIDAEKLEINIPQQSIIKGDEKCHGIAAASIVAKVHRDNQCVKLAKKYPDYAFEKNKGYGTKEHREALKRVGPSQVHRLTFLSKILDESKQLSFWG